MYKHENHEKAPYWCPYCKAVIMVDGEICTEEQQAYWHTYDHMDVAPYAMLVLEDFEVLDVVETNQDEI